MFYYEFKWWKDRETLIQFGINDHTMFWDLYINGKHFENRWAKYTSDYAYTINMNEINVSDYSQEVGCPVFDY